MELSNTELENYNLIHPLYVFLQSPSVFLLSNPDYSTVGFQLCYIHNLMIHKCEFMKILQKMEKIPSKRKTHLERAVYLDTCNLHCLYQ
jgi:hypothetical protein